MRLSLVPAHQKGNAEVHAANAFRWSCWSHGRIRCGRGQCGTDRTGSRYRQQVTIPDVFPDGLYVLGYSWYGGHFEQGDYWSCAEVVINGGKPLAQSYQPVFVNSHNGRCDSTANESGVCRREPCRKRRLRRMQPKAFDGGPPDRIYSSKIQARGENKWQGNKNNNNKGKNNNNGNKWKNNNNNNKWKNNNNNKWKNNNNNNKWKNNNNNNKWKNNNNRNKWQKNNNNRNKWQKNNNNRNKWQKNNNNRNKWSKNNNQSKWQRRQGNRQ
ncbi:hypothetical protein BU14_0491s0001 [Porphyra umbilicalis]|uniref:Uncharacterized protein n=1 Tax=Porphyra umbilicalis TaxID=2786 RepID=A0A1X6NU24_PORUM|nr:hypothetical protein BU14_0491s0001 [Porphyra umbilicalis]|eukprot:OSX71893.1 hypothetical protein BU14_0491s0001 [Porphyra umbilicalis]